MQEPFAERQRYEPIIQCVPNFSDGRNESVLDQIAAAIERHPVRLADWSADVDHNRSVFTFVGPLAPVAAAALAAAEEAVKSIDITSHTGVHPRLGSLDVLPFVPLRGSTLAECAQVAQTVGATIAEYLSLPIFFYGAATEDDRQLPDIRKQAFKNLAPDLGPRSPHPTAGAIAIGARGPLVAFNVNLATAQVDAAKSIASEVRERFAGNVRALGLYLETRGLSQVSLNIIHPERVEILEIVEYVAARAQVLETELIGALPGFSAFTTVRAALKLRGLKPGQVLLESWPTDLKGFKSG